MRKKSQAPRPEGPEDLAKGIFAIADKKLQKRKETKQDIGGKFNKMLMWCVGTLIADIGLAVGNMTHYFRITPK